VGIPLDWRFVDATYPAAEKHWPECGNTGKNQQPESKSGAASLRVQSLHAEKDKRKGKDQPYAGIRR